MFGIVIVPLNLWIYRTFEYYSFSAKNTRVNKAKNTQKCPKKFPYLRPTNFNYDLETTNPESLLMKQLKRHVFTSTASRRCTCFCHQKQWPPGITLTESQTNVNLTKTDVYRGAKSALGGERPVREREREIHKGAGVMGDMDFINSIYRKGM